jgi:hypothetical protein
MNGSALQSRARSDLPSCGRVRFTPMGLLEDAIREHLDLKRRRGADADEVAQAERDALGPPGRPTPLEETAAAALDPDGEVYEDDEADFDDAYEPDEVTAEERLDPGEPARLYDYGAEGDEAELEQTGVLDEDVDVPAFLDDGAERAAEAPEPVGAYAASVVEEEPAVVEETASVEETAIEDEPAAVEETAVEEPPPSTEDEPASAKDPVAVDEPASEDEPATRIMDREAEGDEPGADGEEPEDVLEETPDFLQETPEHDRLWFEQKPPRDFDFGN